MSSSTAPLVLAAALLLAALPAACANNVRLTPGILQSLGTRSFAAPHHATFEAARQALASLGYTPALVQEGQGRIVTARMPYGAQLEIGIDGTGSRTLWRQYELQVVPYGARQTRVVAVPHQYAGERDVSRDRVWELDGAQGERVRWKQLFTAIEANLAVAAPPARPR